MSISEAGEPGGVFVPHAFDEHRVDLGEVRMNYAVTGSSESPALLLLPPQTQSWWSYEAAMPQLAASFQVYAVDLRGQGRSSRTPGRYTLDNIGNDLVRFIDLVIGRPAIVAGNSSGGVLAAWLASYAKPGQVRGVLCEDPPLFSSETNPACGHSIRQSIGPMFALVSKWLGDQWTIGDWAGMQSAAPRELPGHVLAALQQMHIDAASADAADGPPQNMKEYDPEWGRAFWTGTVGVGCDHTRMLASARVPFLLTHHYREIDPDSGGLMGAVSDEQVTRAGELVTDAGQAFDVVDLPAMAHSMHAQDPELFTQTLRDWTAKLPASAEEHR